MGKFKHLKLAATPKKKVLVVSHERSGTHFLMNTLDRNFEYVAVPWLNFDFELGLNFHSAENIMQFFKKLHDRPVLNVVKSHHPFSFFAKLIAYLAQQFHIFYIYRDPRDVMISFQRLINHFRWDEGPRTSSVGDFMRAQPRGGVLRYQKEQTPSMLHRWKDHVEAWHNYSIATNGRKVHLVRFEDLSERFEETVHRIGSIIGEPVRQVVRPSPGENVIYKGRGNIGDHRELFKPEDYDYVREVAGKTMQRLEIPW